MKPRLFIGSSKEGLDIAYAIQENLDFDAAVTVWTQGIFQLSSDTLSDLINALSNFDFAIMVFNPDDIIVIREFQQTTVRDNVVFELGLFIGRLGREKVYFVIPANEKNFHLPTDLTGVTPGTYRTDREDNNLKAALGPFCNQVRKNLKDYIYENLNDLQNESKEAKRIAVEKPYCWEYLLSAELIEQRLEPINRSYKELDKKLIFIKTVSYSGDDYFIWFKDRIRDFKNLTLLLGALINDELLASLGPPGIAGKIIDIKNVADKFLALAKELIAWEYSVQEANPPEELEKVKSILQGWSQTLMSELNKLPNETRRVIEASKKPNPENDELTVQLNIKPPPNMEIILDYFEEYFTSN